ncbi:MAG: nucleoside hydrolase [Halanaerobiales bacterium]
MNYHFKVPDNKKIRIILDTDAACEADDQYAIVHALLTPRFLIRGIVAEQFGGENSVEESYQEIQHILKLMNISGDIPIKRGAPRALSSEKDMIESEGAKFIVNEAMRDVEEPLYVLCQGAITNMALALLIEPEIAERLTCIWIGGASYPKGGWEFNLLNDYHAANIVFKSNLNLWQVPMDCYTRMQVGYAELEKKVRPYGEIGKYLFEQMIELGNSERGSWSMGESWSLGDSPAIGLALNPGCGWSHEIKAPTVDEKGHYHTCVSNQTIKVFHDIDSRYILEDFFAKLYLNYKE